MCLFFVWQILSGTIQGLILYWLSYRGFYFKGIDKMKLMTKIVGLMVNPVKNGGLEKLAIRYFCQAVIFVQRDSFDVRLWGLGFQRWYLQFNIQYNVALYNFLPTAYSLDINQSKKSICFCTKSTRNSVLFI